MFKKEKYCRCSYGSIVVIYSIYVLYLRHADAANNGYPAKSSIIPAIQTFVVCDNIMRGGEKLLGIIYIYILYAYIIIRT